MSLNAEVSNSGGVGYVGMFRKRMRFLGVVFLAAAMSACSSGASNVDHPNAGTKPTTADYAAGLRHVDRLVNAAIEPVQEALATTSTHSVDAMLAARDAVVKGGARSLIKTASNDLQLLAPTSALVNDQGLLTPALDALRNAVSVYSESGYDVQVFNGGPDASLTQAEVSWDSAIRKAYDDLKRQPPISLVRNEFSRLPASKTSWIYAADQTCLSGATKIAPLDRLKRLPTSTSQDENYDDVWRSVLHRSAVQLSLDKRPRGRGALPAAIRSGFGALASAAGIFSRLHSDVAHGDQARLGIDEKDLGIARAPQLRLATALRSYGAVACGAIIQNWAGTGTKTSEGGLKIKVLV